MTGGTPLQQAASNHMATLPGGQHTQAMRDLRRLQRTQGGKSGAGVNSHLKALELVKGATVDFVTEMIRSSFAVVNNPLSESACGCGSSFAVKAFSAAPAID